MGDIRFSGQAYFSRVITFTYSYKTSIIVKQSDTYEDKTFILDNDSDHHLTGVQPCNDSL